MAVATVSFLHTASVHAKTFAALVDAHARALTHRHHVHPELLASARQDGLESARPALRARLQEAMVDADLVLCTCSTVGGLAEQLAADSDVPVFRVDRPMAEAAVRAGRPVVVVVALESTLAPTVDLLRECATGRNLDIRVAPVYEAWERFAAGDTDGFHAHIARHVRAVAQPGDAVVLAEASMAPAVELLDELPASVLASPRLAVEEAARRLANGA